MTRSEQIDELLALLRTALWKTENMLAEEPARVGFTCGLHTRNIVFGEGAPTSTLYLTHHVPPGTQLLSADGTQLGYVTSSRPFSGKLTYRVDILLSADQFKQPLVGMWDDVVTLHYTLEVSR